MARIVLAALLMAGAAACGSKSEYTPPAGEETAMDNGNLTGPGTPDLPAPGNGAEADATPEPEEPEPAGEPQEPGPGEETPNPEPAEPGPDGGEEAANQEEPQPLIAHGLDACVEQHLVEGGKTAYRPQLLTDSLGDLTAKASLDEDTWTDLVDHLLRESVVDGLIDYARFNGDLRQPLGLAMDYLLSRSLPDRATDDRQRAFLVNAYNISMIAIAADLVAAGTTAVPVGPAPFVRNVFTENLATLLGSTQSGFTLDGIEYDRLGMAGRGGGPTPEPRLHVALVCGAMSCPKIRPFAYRGENLDQVLEENMMMFLGSPQHFRVNGNAVAVSSLLTWFADDFASLGGGRKDGIARYLTDSCRSQTEQSVIRNALATDAVSYIPYSWQLNKQPDSGEN